MGRRQQRPLGLRRRQAKTRNRKSHPRTRRPHPLDIPTNRAHVRTGTTRRHRTHAPRPPRPPRITQRRGQALPNGRQRRLPPTTLHPQRIRAAIGTLDATAYTPRRYDLEEPPRAALEKSLTPPSHPAARQPPPGTTPRTPSRQRSPNQSTPRSWRPLHSRPPCPQETPTP